MLAAEFLDHHQETQPNHQWMSVGGIFQKLLMARSGDMSFQVRL